MNDDFVALLDHVAVGIAACGEEGTIEVSCRDDEDDGIEILRIIVRDNGPGLNDEQRERIFEPFFTTKAEGTGLGMAIAKRIIESHGGKISLHHHSEGSGAAFTFTLPRIKVREAQ